MLYEKLKEFKRRKEPGRPSLWQKPSDAIRIMCARHEYRGLLKWYQRQAAKRKGKRSLMEGSPHERAAERAVRKYRLNMAARRFLNLMSEIDR